jgi:hypothetical protein
VIHDKAAVAVKPRPELLPFFRVVTENLVTTPYKMEHWRKRRGLPTRLLHDDRFVRWPEPRIQTEEPSQTRRTMSNETVERICELPIDGLALRAIGQAVGIRHETVRQVVAS